MDTVKVISQESVAALVSRVASVDPAAEEELYNRYRRGVAIILTQALGGQPVAEDLAQETFAVVFEKIRRRELREPERLAGFIWSVAHHLAIDYFRRRRPAFVAEVEEAENIADPAPSPLDQLVSSQQAAAVRRVIDMLGSKRDREILFRFYIEEEDKERICAEFELTSLQFNLVLFRARKQYKKLYEKHVGRQER